MSMIARRPGIRWAVPAAVAVTVFGGGAVLKATSASADPVLPPRTAAQLLADLQTAKLDGLSGTVTQHADLGLPKLPELGGSGSTSLTSLLSGSHTLRVWYSGPDNSRIALLGALGETDLIRSGRDVWIWDSRGNVATHHVLTEEQQRRSVASPADRVPGSPQELAERALKAVDASTVVSTAGSSRVAGRSAYELVIAPRDRASLVGQVRISIDSKQHVPLRVQIYARNATAPAFEAGFTAINFSRPDDAQFRFNPPPGAKVEKEPAAGSDGGTGDGPAAGTDGGAPSKVVGTGWTSVFVAPAPATDPGTKPGTAKPGTAKPDTARPGAGKPGETAAAGDPAGQFGILLDGLPRVSGPWGSGRILSGKLFTILFTDDGRVLAGAVSADRLTQAAADPAATLQGGR